MARRMGRSMDHVHRGPGLDTRVNQSLAVITDVCFDPAEGVFADVTLLPDGPDETIQVGGPYAGGGYGLWFPVQVGDTVLVAVPLGEPAHGPVLVCRMWSSGDPPPAEIQGEVDSETSTFNPVTDVWLRVKDGASLKIKTSGGGSVNISAVGVGAVNLATDSGDVSVTTGSGDVTVTSGGGVTVTAAELIELGSSSLTPVQGAVQGEAIDPFTGSTQFALGNTSTKVLASKA